MSILWAGGEDIDFPNGGSLTTVTTAGQFRAGYARLGLTPPTGNVLCKSVPFVGGAVSSAWLSAQINYTPDRFSAVFRVMIGFGQSGTSNCVMLGTDSSNPLKMALNTFNGTTTTQIASESGTQWQTGLQKIAIQVFSGGSPGINVYNNGSLVFTYSGLALSTFDSVFIMFGTSGPLTGTFAISEIIVANEDTRSLNLCTIFPNGNGTTDNWTGTYTTVNETTISDASPNYVNATAQDQQYTGNSLPAGAWSIKALKMAARLAVSAGPVTAAKVDLGYNLSSTIGFGGSPLILTNSYTTYEQLDSVNPVTSAAWTQTQVNALQFDLRSS